MRHSKLLIGDSKALSSRTVRNLLVDDDWNRLPWLRDESEAKPPRSGQSALPWFIALLVTVASLSYVQGRAAAEAAVPTGSSCVTAAMQASCIRVWEAVPVAGHARTNSPARRHIGGLSPAAAMSSGDRQLLGQWLLLAQTLAPGEPDASPRPVAPS